MLHDTLHAQLCHDQELAIEDHAVWFLTLKTSEHVCCYEVKIEANFSSLQNYEGILVVPGKTQETQGLHMWEESTLIRTRYNHLLSKYSI